MAGIDVSELFSEDDAKYGFVRNCTITPKEGDIVLFAQSGDDGPLVPYLDGYAIIPIEEYRRLGGD